MKYLRHSKIVEIIKEHDVETQHELAQLLVDSDFNVTQATVSRDIKELRLIKILSKNGKYKYSESNESSQLISDRFMKLYKDAVLEVDYAQNIVVVRTLIGSANAAAVAIDALKVKKIVGTIAGDDTIFLLARTQSDALEIKAHFEMLLE